jgi:uncharacterized BrkB/YihY/UPF0761 family membrane protein
LGAKNAELFTSRQQARGCRFLQAVRRSPVSNKGVTRSQFEGAVSLLLLGSLIWVVFVLVPRAMRQRNPPAVVCAVLAALIALLGWLLLGSGVRSS